MKKFLFAIFAVITIFFNSSITYAGEVISTGEGSTIESAVHNAMRAAIEQETGVIIDSKTITQNRQLIDDEIILKSRGFIESYEIIKQTQKSGIFEVIIRANVKSEELKTNLMNILQKKAIVESNMNDPRIAVVAFDDIGNEYAEVENEIMNGLQQQGFSRLIDVAQLDSSLKMRFRNASTDNSLRQALKNQFHVDYVVVVQVKTSQGRRATANLAARTIGTNTGEIIYAGSFSSNTRLFTNNTIDGAIQSASKRAAFAISNAMLNKAAQVEQHITIIVTKNTLNKFNGDINNFNKFINDIQGVNKVFTRSLNNGVAELDVNFDGTAYELSVELNRKNLKVIEMNSEYIKI